MMNRFKILSSLLCVLCLTACGGQVNSRVTLFHEIDKPIQGKSISITKGVMKNESTLEWKKNKELLSQYLSKVGFQVKSTKTPDYTAVFSYSVDNGTLITSTYARPVFGITGYSGANTFGTVNSFGGFGTYNSTTTFTPTYGITGYVPETRNDLLFSRLVVIKIIKKGRLVWDMKLQSIGFCPNVSVVMDSLLQAAFKDFPGKSGSSQEIVVPWDGEC